MKHNSVISPPEARDKNEFLNDISSFANAEGGDFIIVIDQKGKKADGIKVDHEDVLMSQLEQIMLHSITPRLMVHPQTWIVSLSNGNRHTREQEQYRIVQHLPCR